MLAESRLVRAGVDLYLKYTGEEAQGSKTHSESQLCLCNHENYMLLAQTPCKNIKSCLQEAGYNILHLHSTALCLPGSPQLSILPFFSEYFCSSTLCASRGNNVP